MNKFTDWLNKHIVPFAEKMVKNPYIAAVSSAFTIILPLILVASIVSLYDVICGYLPFDMPSLALFSNYSMSIITLVIAWVIPHVVMEKKGHGRYALPAGMIGLASTLCALNGTLEDGILSLTFGNLGPGGTMIALVMGILTAVVFNASLKLHLLENSEMPDFIVEWINSTLPAIGVLAICYVASLLNFDLNNFLSSILAPLFSFGQSYLGMLVIVMVPNFLFSFGIGTRTTSAFRNPIYYAGIAANIALVSEGLAATDIVTFETIHTCALTCLGGTGCTLTLVLLMLFSKSKRLKTEGKVFLVPSLFNINEPVVFGEVVFNPLLMIPMWINGFTTATIVYFTMSTGLLNIPCSHWRCACNERF